MLKNRSYCLRAEINEAAIGNWVNHEIGEIVL